VSSAYRTAYLINEGEGKLIAKYAAIADSLTPLKHPAGLTASALITFQQQLESFLIYTDRVLSIIEPTTNKP